MFILQAFGDRLISPLEVTEAWPSLKELNACVIPVISGTCVCVCVCVSRVCVTCVCHVCVCHVCVCHVCVCHVCVSRVCVTCVCHVCVYVCVCVRVCVCVCVVYIWMRTCFYICGVCVLWAFMGVHRCVCIRGSVVHIYLCEYYRHFRENTRIILGFSFGIQKAVK